jgi:hypothetical protein
LLTQAAYLPLACFPPLTVLAEVLMNLPTRVPYSPSVCLLALSVLAQAAHSPLVCLATRVNHSSLTGLPPPLVLAQADLLALVPTAHLPSLPVLTQAGLQALVPMAHLPLLLVLAQAELQALVPTRTNHSPLTGLPPPVLDWDESALI